LLLTLTIQIVDVFEWLSSFGNVKAAFVHHWVQFKSYQSLGQYPMSLICTLQKKPRDGKGWSILSCEL